MYSGPRIATFGQCVSELVHAGGTIMAGFSCANVLAKLLVYRPLKSLSATYGGQNFKKMLTTFRPRTVTMTLGKGGNRLRRRVEVVAVAVVNSKTQLVASSRELTDSLNQTWKAYEGVRFRRDCGVPKPGN